MKIFKRYYVICFLLSFGHQALASTSLCIEGSELLNHVTYLSSNKINGRLTGSKGSQLAKRYIINELQESGVLPFNSSFKHPFTFKYKGKNYNGENIIGELPNRFSVNSLTKYVIISAHFDHIGSFREKIFNGADDNASGVSVLLELAKTLNVYNSNIRVILLFTDGEEQQLKGAKHFVNEYHLIVQNTLLNINIDMIAGSKSSNTLFTLEKRLHSILTSSDLREFKELKLQEKRVKMKRFRQMRLHSNKQVKWLRASDHYMFYRRDVPIIYYGVGLHENYHTENDSATNLNINLMTANANIILHHINFFINKLSKNLTS